MPELPEIASRAAEMKKELIGRKIAGVKVFQPKCLNVSKAKFIRALKGAKIEEISHHGKWIFTHTTKGWLLINMGMGGELLLVPCDVLPEKRQVVFEFGDGDCLSVSFWWFGHTHYAAEGKLDGHKMSAKLGPNALDVKLPEFRKMLEGRRGNVKSFLLNQERIAGIGNAYAHDVLFLAGLHPLRTIDTLEDDEVKALWNGVRKGLGMSLKRGGAWYEKDLYGKPGRFTQKMLLVGYREGEPCPTCGGKVVKIKTGSTSTFICPKCQPLKAKKSPAKKTTKTKKRAAAKRRK
jgi:formamidopyrimidine-DNA glycosylase